MTGGCQWELIALTDCVEVVGCTLDWFNAAVCSWHATVIHCWRSLYEEVMIRRRTTSLLSPSQYSNTSMTKTSTTEFVVLFSLA